MPGLEDVAKNLAEENDGGLDDILDGATEEVIEDDGPCRTDSDWHEYVMKQFVPSELAGSDKLPKVAGLRRVAQKLIGRIVNSYPDIIQSPSFTGRIATDATGRKTPMLEPAVVKYTVVFETPTGDITYSDVATVYLHNTDFEFAIHPAETASTKAESRALRKALGLQVIADEEKVKNPVQVTKVEDTEDEDRIKSSDITVLRMLCVRKGVKLDDCIRSHTSGEYGENNLLELPRAAAKEIIRELQGAK